MNGAVATGMTGATGTAEARLLIGGDAEPPGHRPVFGRADVVLSPHLMGLSVGATRATFAAAADGVADVLERRRPAALANPEWDLDSVVPSQEDQ